MINSSPEKHGLLPKPEDHLRLYPPSIKNASIPKTNIIKAKEGLTKDAFLETVEPDKNHFLLNWGHSALAYERGLGPLVQGMTYEMQFAEGNARFVNIDIDRIVENPVFQKDQNKQLALLDIIDQEIKHLTILEIKEFEKDLANLKPKDERFRHILQDSITHLKSDTKQNGKDLTSLAAVQYFLDQCQQSGVLLKGKYYDEIMRILQLS